MGMPHQNWFTCYPAPFHNNIVVAAACRLTDMMAGAGNSRKEPGSRTEGVFDGELAAGLSTLEWLCSSHRHRP